MAKIRIPKSAWLLLAFMLLFQPSARASDPATLTVTKAQHGREAALKVGSVLEAAAPATHGRR
jgi:hypothetical protein